MVPLSEVVLPIVSKAKSALAACSVSSSTPKSLKSLATTFGIGDDVGAVALPPGTDHDLGRTIGVGVAVGVHGEEALVAVGVAVEDGGHVVLDGVVPEGLVVGVGSEALGELGLVEVDERAFSLVRGQVVA